MPSVFAPNDDSLNYIRPLHSNTDVNIDEWISSTSMPGGAITITAHTTGDPMKVTLSASSTKIQVGEPATFTAQASGTGATGAITYRWEFFNRTRRTTAESGIVATETNTWTAPGKFYVVVSAHDPATKSYGISAPVPIRVGPEPPPGGHHPGSGGHHHRHHHPPSGSDHGHHHHNQGGHHGSKQQPPAPSTGHHSTQRAHQPGSSGPVRHQRHQRQKPPGNGPTVAGLLLTGAQVYAVPRPSRAVPQTVAAEQRPADSFSVPWRIALGIAVPLALLGLGMAGEALQLRRRVARMSA